jgi:hypothetical protein
MEYRKISVAPGETIPRGDTCMKTKSVGELLTSLARLLRRYRPFIRIILERVLLGCVNINDNTEHWHGNSEARLLTPYNLHMSRDFKPSHNTSEV